MGGLLMFFTLVSLALVVWKPGVFLIAVIIAAAYYS
tara:strand:- start:1443 stop:1550 length:108 start_codon:yes stop_codon:yes gene_type:complete